MQEIADVDAKFRQKQAESQGRLESVSLEGISLGAGKRRPSRRSQYENLLKVSPALLVVAIVVLHANVVYPMLNTALAER